MPQLILVFQFHFGLSISILFFFSGGYRFLSVFDVGEDERKLLLKIDGLSFVGGRCVEDGGFEGGGVMRIEGRFEVSLRFFFPLFIS